MKRNLQHVTLAFGVLALVACVTNPYTERSQLLLVSEAEEAKMGAQAYEEILKEKKITLARDPRAVEPVKRIAARIIEAAKHSKYAESARQFEWEVRVIKDDTMMNAFALPGGKIAVYTGIFPVAKNDDGLAAIMGHEVVHALARHGAERMSQGQLAQAGLTVADLLIGAHTANSTTAKLAMAALGLGVNVGILLPFGRSHESEADYVGLLLAAQAGYDPREAVHVWERMGQLTKGQPPEFLSTHPSHGTRITQLQEWMPEALTLYRPRPGERAADLPALTPQ